MKDDIITKNVLEKFRNGRSILALSRATGISRITLNAYSRGQTPNLGVLLENYMTGTNQGQELAMALLSDLHPYLLGILPPLIVVRDMLIQKEKFQNMVKEYGQDLPDLEKRMAGVPIPAGVV